MVNGKIVLIFQNITKQYDLMIYIKQYFVTFDSILFNSKTRVDNYSEKERRRSK